MGLPALVLVHGGAHAADCWDLTVDELHRQVPELTVLAVDLPGRAGKPGDLAALSIRDCVESVVADIEAAGLGEVVICGHSLGGVTVPGVVAKLGASRVCGMILAAAFLPPQGTSVLDTLGGPLGWYARRTAAARQAPIEMPPSRCAIGVLQRHDAPATTVPVAAGPRGGDRPGHREGRSQRAARRIPWTWILTLSDWSLSQRTQR